MIERGQVDFGLVVNGESSRQVLESTIRLLQDPATDQEAFREDALTARRAVIGMIVGGALTLVICTLLGIVLRRRRQG